MKIRTSIYNSDVFRDSDMTTNIFENTHNNENSNNSKFMFTNIAANKDIKDLGRFLLQV